MSKSLNQFFPLPYDGLLPNSPVATKDICFDWLLKIISPHKKMPPIHLLTFIVSPQMLNFFQGKCFIRIRNIITKGKFAPGIS